MDEEMILDKDMEVMTNIRRFQSRKRRSFGKAINSKDLTSDDMDELFLSA